MAKIQPRYIDPSGGPIQNNSTPANPTDLVNRQYFDTHGYTLYTTSTTNATLTTIASIPIADNTSVIITAHISGRRTNGTGHAGYTRNVLVYRENGGGATIEGTVDTPFSRESVNQWDATMSISSNNLLIQVQGRAGDNINWTAHVMTTVAS